MPTSDDPSRWVGEDEMLLADAEGSESARADAAFGQAVRRDKGLQRRGQLERIREVYGLGEDGLYDDVRIQVFYGVIGYVHEQKWREAIADLRRQILTDERPGEREWRELQRSDPDNPDRPTTFKDEALFLPDGEAIGRMTHQLKEALARANAYLRGGGSALVAEEQRAYPNPYRDLWVLDPIDPDHRGEILDGGSWVVVPAAGGAYHAAHPRPPEVIGMIGPPDLEWD